MNNTTIPFPLLTDKVQGLMQQHLMKRLRFYARYRADYHNWYLRGDGRTLDDGGKGWAYPECIHGADRWTSYDNICGPCEDGWGYWDAEREVEEAFHLSVYSLKVFDERFRKAKPIISDRNAPDALRTALRDWVLSATNI